MNNLTASELTEIIETIQESLHPHSQVKWDYWFRSETYEMLDEWEIDRETIQQLVHNLTSDDVIKSELQHGNRRGLVLVFAPWLYPSLGQQTFAYLKLALTFDKTNQLHTVSVLSFKAANRDYEFDFPQTTDCRSYYEYNYWTWLTSQPQLLLGIPVAEITPYLIETAVTTDPKAIIMVPLKLITDSLVEQACTIDPTVIMSLPEKYWTKSRLRMAVRAEPRIMLDLPVKMQTLFMALDACRKEPELLLEIAPRWLQRPLLEQVAQAAPEIVAQLKPYYLTDSLVKLLLQTDATALYQLPYEHWNEKRLHAAVKQDPFVLSMARSSDLTPMIIATEIAVNPDVIQVLPAKVIDGQMAYELAWEHPHLFPFVPQSYVNQALVDHVLDVQPQLLAIVPKQFKQTAMCAKLVATDPSLWQYVPKHIKTRLQQVVPMSA